MKYSIFTPEQHQQLGSYDQSFNNQWDNDYVLLNTDKWRPKINHETYKCKTENNCKICPNTTSGYPVNLKDFNIVKKIIPPDNINVEYIKEILNK